MTLKNKTIILISSERWGEIFISKHNYALALAKRGNRVFFLDPIDTSLSPGEIKIRDSGAHPDLKVVSYRPFFPMLLKFHQQYLFEKLIRIAIKRVIRRLKIRPDIVWDFNCAYLYNDLSIFNAPLKIFNPVDFLAEKARSKKADMIISVSDLILDQYALKDVPRLRLNHGLGEPFVVEAKKTTVVGKNERIQVGYLGNLAMDSLDRDVFLRVIRENPDLDFNIIGPTSGKDNNLGVRGKEDQISSFMLELRELQNVILHGPKPQQEVPAMLNKFDILLLCYKRTASFKCDNSHKMIEYLSSGKVVVCTYLSVYAGNDLVEMTNEDHNEELPALFKEVAENIDRYNSEAKQRKRKDFALDNTYENHLSTIEIFIERSVVKTIV